MTQFCCLIQQISSVVPVLSFSQFFSADAESTLGFHIALRYPMIQILFFFFNFKGTSTVVLLKVSHSGVSDCFLVVSFNVFSFLCVFCGENQVYDLIRLKQRRMGLPVGMKSGSYFQGEDKENKCNKFELKQDLVKNIAQSSVILACPFTHYIKMSQQAVKSSFLGGFRQLPR